MGANDFGATASLMHPFFLHISGWFHGSWMQTISGTNTGTGRTALHSWQASTGIVLTTIYSSYSVTVGIPILACEFSGNTGTTLAQLYITSNESLVLNQYRRSKSSQTWAIAGCQYWYSTAPFMDFLLGPSRTNRYCDDIHKKFSTAPVLARRYWLAITVAVMTIINM